MPLPATGQQGRLDDDHCYRIASSRDGRFDGMFVTAVVTTRIYCRPSCPAVTPRRRNVRFYPTPAAAQENGFRACKRCRPDAAPGSADWDSRADAVARAVRLIGDGLIEREGVEGLARRLGYSPRHLTRLLVAEVGTGPLRLAMAHRVQAARTLLETTDLPVTEVAWASGFGSIRQFNDLVRRVYASTPRDLRDRASRTDPGQMRCRGGAGGSGTGSVIGVGAPGRAAGAAQATVIRARLAYRAPLDAAGLLGFLGARAVPGAESFDGRTFATSMRLPHGFAVASVSAPAPDRGAADGTARATRPALDCELHLSDIRDYATAVSRLRRLLDLDADPTAIVEILGSDPLLRPMVTATPGTRMPGTTDVFELAVRAVVGQQVSVASARVVNGRLTRLFGEPLPFFHSTVHTAFPSAEALAGADPASVPLPRSRAVALQNLASVVADGILDLHPGVDRDGTERSLVALPGIGPWTAAYIRMRGLGDPDVMPPNDAAIRRALNRLGGPSVLASNPDGAPSGAWRPWRSYATAHLWSQRPPTTNQGERT